MIYITVLAQGDKESGPLAINAAFITLVSEQRLDEGSMTNIILGNGALVRTEESMETVLQKIDDARNDAAEFHAEYAAFHMRKETDHAISIDC